MVWLEVFFWALVLQELHSRSLGQPNICSLDMTVNSRSSLCPFRQGSRPCLKSGSEVVLRKPLLLCPLLFGFHSPAQALPDSCMVHNVLALGLFWGSNGNQYWFKYWFWNWIGIWRLKYSSEWSVGYRFMPSKNGRDRLVILVFYKKEIDTRS